MPRSIARTTFALFVLIAIALQFRETVFVQAASAANFLSFFTIESNVFAAVMLVVTASGRAADGAGAMLRGAATLYMTITGIVYATLLASGPQPLIPWVNVTLHYIAPLALLLDWLSDPSRINAPRVRAIAAWLAYPVLYGTYSLIRGAALGWYPYGFLDPRANGYGMLAVTFVVFAAGGAAIAWALLAAGARAMSLRSL